MISAPKALALGLVGATALQFGAVMVGTAGWILTFIGAGCLAALTHAASEKR